MNLITCNTVFSTNSTMCAINLILPPLLTIALHYISKSLDFKAKNDLRFAAERKEDTDFGRAIGVRPPPSDFRINIANS